jgi:UbiD family decarboxylase
MIFGRQSSCSKQFRPINRNERTGGPACGTSGVYRHVGAGGTVRRPTQIGPAMIFNNVKGHEEARVIIGLLASRQRVALMLGTKPERLGFLLNEAVQKPLAPVTIPQDKAKCQEVVHYADEPGLI